MERYKLVFRRTLDLLEKYSSTVDKNCLSVIQNEILGAASEFEIEMLTAASDELSRIRKIKRQITGLRIDIESYRPAFMMAFYLLEKYYLTISDELWSEVAQSLGGPETKFEVALMVAAVNEIERIYKAKFTFQQQEEPADDRQTA